MITLEKIEAIHPVSFKRIELLHPILREEAKEILLKVYKAGVSIIYTQTLRTIEEQNALYAIGRTKKGRKVTNAKGGSSYHNYGLAIDFCLFYGNGSVSWDMTEDMDGDKIIDWMEVVKIFKSYGWEWGGDFKGFFDAPHFQKTFGLSITDCKDRYARNGFKNYINI